MEVRLGMLRSRMPAECVSNALSVTGPYSLWSSATGKLWRLRRFSTTNTSLTYQRSNEDGSKRVFRRLPRTVNLAPQLPALFAREMAVLERVVDIIGMPRLHPRPLPRP